jgi:hypothetical protein
LILIQSLYADAIIYQELGRMPDRATGADWGGGIEARLKFHLVDTPAAGGESSTRYDVGVGEKCYLPNKTLGDNVMNDHRWNVTTISKVG